MRPIYQTSVASSSTYTFPPIVPDVLLTPGNATWVAKLTSGGSSSATVTLWFSNDDPFAPNFDPLTAVWVQEMAAFQTGATTVGPSVTLTGAIGSVTSASVGAYAYLPRLIQFRLSACTNSAVVVIEFVQASGGRS